MTALQQLFFRILARQQTVWRGLTGLTSVNFGHEISKRTSSETCVSLVLTIDELIHKSFSCILLYFHSHTKSRTNNPAHNSATGLELVVKLYLDKQFNKL